jgi:hypothetical protein
MITPSSAPVPPVPAPDEVQADLLRQTEALREVSLEKVRSGYGLWVAGAVPLEKLCSEAGNAFEEYTVAFEALLGNASPGVQDHAVKWMREHYRQAILTHAHAIRDVIGDSTARHAVAQILQTRMLRTESRFRKLIDEPAEPAKPAQSR